MSKYLMFIGLIVFSVGQVAWLPFITVGGFFFPISLVYFWWIKKHLEFGELSLFAFIGGLIIDLLGTSLLGTHSLILLICVGEMTVLEKRIISNEALARFVSLLIGIITYLWLKDLLISFL